MTIIKENIILKSEIYKGKRIDFYKHEEENGDLTISINVNDSNGWENTNLTNKKEALEFAKLKIDKLVNKFKIGSGGIVVFLSEEDKLRKLGVIIPTYPRQGKVMFEGKQIGFTDNFNGTYISDKKFIEKYLIKKQINVLYRN